MELKQLNYKGIIVHREDGGEKVRISCKSDVCVKCCETGVAHAGKMGLHCGDTCM